MPKQQAFAFIDEYREAALRLLVYKKVTFNYRRI